MALNFANGINAVRQQASGQAQQEREPTMFWLNIGFEAEDGTFISLPVGLPLDTMQKRQVRGNNPEWNALVQASNALLDYVLEGAKTLQPGQETLANGLSIQIKRVAEAPSEIPAEENMFLKAFGGVSFGAPVAPVSHAKNKRTA